jgi:hypothetical protein
MREDSKAEGQKDRRQEGKVEGRKEEGRRQKAESASLRSLPLAPSAMFCGADFENPRLLERNDFCFVTHHYESVA